MIPDMEVYIQKVYGFQPTSKDIRELYNVISAWEDTTGETFDTKLILGLNQEEVKWVIDDLESAIQEKEMPVTKGWLVAEIEEQETTIDNLKQINKNMSEANDNLSYLIKYLKGEAC